MIAWASVLWLWPGSLLAVGLGPESAGRDEGGTWLQWDAPAIGCPTQAEVAAEVEGRVEGGVEGRIRVQAKVTRTERGYALRLHSATDTASDAREAEAAECAALTQAVVVVVTLMTLPEAEAAESTGGQDALGSEPDPSPAVVPEAPDPGVEQGRGNPPIGADRPATTEQEVHAAPATRAPEPATLRPRTSLVRWSLGAVAGARLRTLPAPTFAWGGTLAVERGWLRVGLSATLWSAQSASGRDGAVEVRGGAAVPSVCAGWARRFRAHGCVGLEVGGLQGRGRDVMGETSARGLWLAPTAGARLGVHAHPRVVIGAGTDLALVARSPSFVLVGDATELELFRPKRLGVSAYGGVTLIFGAAPHDP